MKLTLTNPNNHKSEIVDVDETSRKNGGECIFYRINRKVGVKMYIKKERAILTRTNQIDYWEKKLAPKILSPILQIKRENGEIEWGYLTQVASTNVTWPQSYRFFDKIRGMKNIPPFVDCQKNNLGKINNRIVAIDFGMGIPSR